MKFIINYGDCMIISQRIFQAFFDIMRKKEYPKSILYKLGKYLLSCLQIATKERTFGHVNRTIFKIIFDCLTISELD